MAEHGAHLTSASPASRPSIFEVLAQDSLMFSIRPAMKHAIRVLCESHPESFGWLLHFYDEIYTLLDFILQNFYLHKHCSSFAENFYDLKRVPVVGTQVDRLPQNIYWKSIICLVVLPYIKHKLDQKFEDLRHSLNTSRSQTKKLHRAFVGAYPYFHTCWAGAIFGYQLTYMFGKSEWHSPLVQLAGVKLCRDLEPSNNKTSDKLRLLANKILNWTGRALSLGLSVGVFFLQFLDWWYANDSEHASLTALPIPEPPGMSKIFTCPRSSLCPVCQRTRTNDTALSVSGYVFCYPCIHQYISDHGVCPVTGYKAKMEHLVRLYLPDS
ncbi:hypothetical protein ScPMuIL_015613 [Solemya velum]